MSTARRSNFNRNHPSSKKHYNANSSQLRPLNQSILSQYPTWTGEFSFNDPEYFQVPTQPETYELFDYYLEENLTSTLNPNAPSFAPRIHRSTPESNQQMIPKIVRHPLPKPLQHDPKNHLYPQAYLGFITNLVRKHKSYRLDHKSKNKVSLNDLGKMWLEEAEKYSLESFVNKNVESILSEDESSDEGFESMDSSSNISESSESSSEDLDNFLAEMDIVLWKNGSIFGPVQSQAESSFRSIWSHPTNVVSNAI